MFMFINGARCMIETINNQKDLGDFCWYHILSPDIRRNSMVASRKIIKNYLMGPTVTQRNPGKTDNSMLCLGSGTVFNSEGECALGLASEPFLK